VPTTFRRALTRHDRNFRLGGRVKFARIVYLIAGIWGIVVLPPLYFMAASIGEQYPPPISHVEFYYGFVGVALAWQFVFLIISRDPLRYRPIMFVSLVEKFSFVIAVLVLYLRGQLGSDQTLLGASADLTLGVLFVVALLKTRGLSRA
jgi:hypothetical protein